MGLICPAMRTKTSIWAVHRRSLAISAILRQTLLPTQTSPTSSPLIVPKTTTIQKEKETLPLPREIPPTRALLLIYVPVPPTSWPSHLEMVSPLLAATSTKLKAHGIGVNVVYDTSVPPQGNKLLTKGNEVFSAKLFWVDGRQKHFNLFSLETLSSDELESDLAYTPVLGTGGLPVPVAEIEKVPKVILICTHGSRDCRCRDKGGPLVDTLKAEISRRGLESIVKVGEVAHVGGHKYAANAILLPYLDMLSNLTATDAPQLISHLLSISSTTSLESSRMWNHWRGRYGLTADQQSHFWALISQSDTVNQKEEVKETVQLRFKTFEQREIVVNAKLGENLLQVGKENGLPSLEGVCGGNCECATCHLYLSTSPKPPVSQPSEIEDDMLAYALAFKADESRLGCQIRVTKELGDWCKAGGIIGLPRF
ncbi:hypothetical protein L204_103525 [Cryptococcus depauperatus]|nr:hypothetical protein L204_01841 [Cryptococcus depauperatus CBS 7855]